MPIINSKAINLPYNQMTALKQQGKLSIGIDPSRASLITNSGLAPKGAITSAYRFFMFLGYAALAGGTYLGFTSSWWWLLVGIVAMFVIWKGNIRGNHQNILDAAFQDQDFFEDIAERGGWIYQVDEDTKLLLETAYSN